MNREQYINAEKDKIHKRLNRGTKKTTSIRVYENDKKELIEKYDSIQKAIDYLIEKELH